MAAAFPGRNVAHSRRSLVRMSVAPRSRSRRARATVRSRSPSGVRLNGSDRSQAVATAERVAPGRLRLQISIGAQPADAGFGLHFPPAAERIPSLNAVVVPDGADEAAVRRELLTQHNIEIGGAMGPLAGKIWRVGFMGSGATHENVARFLEALRQVLGR